MFVEIESDRVFRFHNGPKILAFIPDRANKVFVRVAGPDSGRTFSFYSESSLAKNVFARAGPGSKAGRVVIKFGSPGSGLL